jgi:hypothetical protein
MATESVKANRVRPPPEVRAAMYHAEHPEVYERFKYFAHKIRDAGREWASADGILHLIRAEYWFERGQSEFMVNDVCSAYFARKLIAEDETFRGFFELRKTRSDRQIATAQRSGRLC